MTKAPIGLQDKILAFIYFVGYEVLLYSLLSYLLFDPVEKNPDESQVIIVQNWNALVYFILLYAIVIIGTLLLLTSALPRLHKPQVMVYFWLSWLALPVMLLLAFN